MNTYFSKILITIGIAFMAFGNSVSADENKLPKRVIVQVKGTETGDLNGEVISSKQIKKQTTLTVEVPTGMSTAAFIKELKQEDHVIHVEEDHLMTLTYTPSDVYYSSQTHHNNIQSEAAWDRSIGTNVIVAVLDNGIDMNHEDLKGKIVNPYDTVYDSPYTLSPGKHGTHVAGIVGSQMDNYYGGVGVAPDTAIMPIDVFIGESAYTSDVIEGVYRAVDQGADIINMSLGSYHYNYSFQQAINYAYARDVVVIAAAGNDATSAAHYPSSYDHVISVGSTTSYDTLSSFSNYGWNIDITAPGSQIVSTTPYNSYGSMSGTSMASPVVAGVAALVKSAEPGLSVDELTERLTSTADDLGSPGRDYFYGYGRVNAKEALHIRQLDPVRIDEFSDASTVVTGKVPEQNGHGTVVLHDPLGGVIGSADKLYGGDRFKINTPRYTAGTTLSVIYYDSYGNHSEQTWFTVVDRTAPIKPSVNPVSDTVTTVSGKAEVASTVTVKAGTALLGQATTNKDGLYTVTIKKQKAGTVLRVASTDAAGNVSPIVETTVVDKTAPVISGVSDVIVEAGLAFDTKRGLSASDETDGNLTALVAVSGAVDVNKTGVYILTYTVKDRAGNVGKLVRRVTVKDTVKPVLNGVKAKTIYWNSRFDAKTGITATDNISGNLTTSIKVSGTVNVKKIGSHYLTYSVTDKSGNTTTVVRKIVVKDHVKPVISGAKSKSIKLKSSFKPLSGVTAKDNVDGTLTKSIKVTGKVNTQRKGVYPLTYTVKDKGGNSAVVKIKITVK